MKLLPAHSTASLINAVHQSDIFDLCERVYRAGVLVDMILCDLPYGTTACAWDTVIPFEPMWMWFKRIIKPRGAIVLTASQPFTSALVMSNPQMFKYSWVWVKTKASNHTNAKMRPMTGHEDVLVFSGGTTANGSSSLMNYFPQGVRLVNRPVYRPSSKFGGVHHSWAKEQNAYIQEYENYPTTVIQVSNPNNDSLHPTQKPVALFDYLIRTYTQIGDIVFDPTAGSGTTAVAARGCNRRYIVGDSSAKYVDVMRERLAKPYQLDMFYHAQQQDVV